MPQIYPIHRNIKDLKENNSETQNDRNAHEENGRRPQRRLGRGAPLDAPFLEVEHVDLVAVVAPRVGAVVETHGAAIVCREWEGFMQHRIQIYLDGGILCNIEFKYIRMETGAWEANEQCGTSRFLLISGGALCDLLVYPRSLSNSVRNQEACIEGDGPP